MNFVLPGQSFLLVSAFLSVSVSLNLLKDNNK